jgi:hypothetical protein
MIKKCVPAEKHALSAHVLQIPEVSASF